MNKWMHACMMKIIWKGLRVGEKITNCRRFSKIILQCPSLSVINLCKLVFEQVQRSNLGLITWAINNKDKLIEVSTGLPNRKIYTKRSYSRNITSTCKTDTFEQFSFPACTTENNFGRRFITLSTMQHYWGETAVNSYKTSWGSACCL